jgi:hypothetical protein
VSPLLATVTVPLEAAVAALTYAPSVEVPWL